MKLLYYSACRCLFSYHFFSSHVVAKCNVLNMYDCTLGSTSHHSLGTNSMFRRLPRFIFMLRCARTFYSNILKCLVSSSCSIRMPSLAPRAASLWFSLPECTQLIRLNIKRNNTRPEMRQTKALRLRTKWTIFALWSSDQQLCDFKCHYGAFSVIMIWIRMKTSRNRPREIDGAARMILATWCVRVRARHRRQSNAH